MEPLKAGAAAIALIAVATGCATNDAAGTSSDISAAYQPVQTDAATLETRLAALETDAFDMAPAANPNIDAIIAAMPALVTISYDEQLTDRSGAAVVRGLKIAPSMMPTIGFEIGELRVWGLDGDFAVARLNGERLDETAPLARRLEAANTRLYGLEGVVGMLMGLAASDPDMPDMTFDSYNFTIGKIVYDDLVLRPYVMDAKTPEMLEDAAQFFPIVQQIAAVNRTIAVDTVATYDLSAAAQVTIDGMPNTFNMAMDLAGSRGQRGGDVDQSVGRGFRYAIDLPSAAASGGPPMKMDVGLDSFSTNGMRLDRVMDHLARGVMPERDSPGLLSLGVTQLAGERVALNDKEIYTVGGATVDLSEFHWFIPTKASFSTSNAVYDIKGLLDWVQETEGDAFGPEEAEMVNNIMAAAANYGLDKPSFDGLLGWNWDAATGAGAIDVDFGIDDYMRFNFDFAGLLPDFNSVSALIPDDIEQTDEDALEDLFQTNTKFSNMTFDIVDEGGLEKSFALAIDVAKLMPEDNAEFAMLRNQTPEGLRQMASSLLYLAAAGAAQEIPAAQDYITKVANFVTSGGALRLSVAPDQPMGLAELEALEDTEPDQIFEMVGLSLTHEAPAQEQAQ